MTDLLQKDPDRALSEMISAYGGLVSAVIRGILPTSSQDEIEECVSDTFLYVFEHRHRLDFSKGSVKAYLCSAAKNRAYDILREAKRRQSTKDKFDSFAPSLTVPSAEESVLANTDRDALIAAILSLGEPDARILICRYYFNMKSAEIAAIVGLKQNTVDQRAGRALKKLAYRFRKGESHAIDAETSF